MEIKKVLAGVAGYDQAKLDRIEERQDKARKAKVKVDSGDRTGISEEAKLLSEAFKAASGAPDVRRDKVEEIKARIAAGNYVVDAQKIAQGVIRDDLDFFGGRG